VAAERPLKIVHEPHEPHERVQLRDSAERRFCLFNRQDRQEAQLAPTVVRSSSSLAILAFLAVEEKTARFAGLGGEAPFVGFVWFVDKK
jgi:hypothetical protein